jgi:hypothetical protein
MLKYQGCHPAYYWFWLAGKTSGIWQYTMDSLTRCVWQWVVHHRKNTRRVSSQTEDDCVWHGCGQPSGESPQSCHSRQSDKKTSMGVPPVSHLADYSSGWSWPGDLEQDDTGCSNMECIQELLASNACRGRLSSEMSANLPWREGWCTAP